MIFLNIIRADLRDPNYRYYSDEVNDETWSNDRSLLECLAREEKLYFFTFWLNFPSPNGTKMFAISDEYIPDSSVRCELLYNPTVKKDD